MSRIRAVLFDKDGTLFDFGATWESWAASFLRRIAQGDEARAASIGAAIGFDLPQMEFHRGSVVIAGTPGEIARALSAHVPGLSPAEMLAVINEEAAQAPQIEVTPLVPYLTGLQQAGLRLGVATNDAEAPARAHLDAAGVTHLFDFIAGFDSGFGGKPMPGQMNAFLEAVDVPAGAAVMVGDSTHDLRAGRAAGMHCVAVLTGLASAADLAPHADVVLRDISHLPDWIRAQI
jgi:phosphoglycolate phosphatase